MPDLRGKLSKVTKLVEAVARPPLKWQAKFLYKKVQISTPFIGQGRKIEELLIKIMNKIELKGPKGQFRLNTL